MKKLSARELYTGQFAFEPLRSVENLFLAASALRNTREILVVRSSTTSGVSSWQGEFRFSDRYF